jgi:hypothetical protein
MEEHLGGDGLSRRDILVKRAGAFCAAGLAPTVAAAQIGSAGPELQRSLNEERHDDHHD